MKSTSSEQYVGLLQKKDRKMQSSENCWDWMYSVCCWRKGRPTRLEHAECEADGDLIKVCRILVTNYKCQHFYWWEMFRTRWEDVRHWNSDPKDHNIITSQQQYRFVKLTFSELYDYTNATLSISHSEYVHLQSQICL